MYDKSDLCGCVDEEGRYVGMKSYGALLSLTPPQGIKRMCFCNFYPEVSNTS